MTDALDPSILDLALRLRDNDRRMTLRQLLALRFGPLSEAAEGVIESADRERLQQLFEQAAGAETLDQAISR